MSQTVSDALAAAREAFSKDDWPAALDLYKQVGADDLAAEDLEAMADAAWWTARMNTQASTGLLYIGLALVMAGSIAGASITYLTGVPV